MLDGRSTGYESMMGVPFEGPVNCPICGKILSRRDYLRIHMRQHTGEKPYKCPYCPRRCAERCNLRKHIGAVHGSECLLRTNIRK